MPQPEADKEIDFTHYLEKRSQSQSPVVEKTTRTPWHFPWLVMVVVIILIGLAAALWYLLKSSPQNANIETPPGYRLIESKDAPPRLEKINP